MNESTYRLSRYLGANLLTKFTADLNVYGAEESPEYEFEDSFDGTLSDCLDALQKFQRSINQHGLDAYLTLEPWNGSISFSGDFRHILEDLINEDYITQETFEDYYYSV